MRNITRDIEEVKEIRGDLSNWLVHLTKGNHFRAKEGRFFKSAKECLSNILRKNTIFSQNTVGHFSYRSWYPEVDKDDLKAVCFTETPIEEIFLFPNIRGKGLKFSSYGLVFSRDDLMRGPCFAAPVMYFPQPDGDTHYLETMKGMGGKHYKSFKDILFLYQNFGETKTGEKHDFRWEREWRLKGNLGNISDLVRFGLCPESDIDYFESEFKPVIFVDPFFSAKQIEKKLKKHGII